MPDLTTSMAEETTGRLARIAAGAAAGELDAAVAMLADCVAADGVIQAFGTGHSQAFAMEVAGRAGGLIPTARVGLADLVLRGGQDASRLGTAELERDPSVVDALWAIADPHPSDVFVIASNSGVNGSVVGFALKAKQEGHGVIAVTSLEHTNGVTPKHPSGKRLSEVADIVIDNLAPYGDATIALGDDVRVGAVSSMTSAFVAQLLTIGVAQRLAASGTTPPVYLSANIPGGDEHNSRLESRYGDRLRRSA